MSACCRKGSVSEISYPETRNTHSDVGVNFNGNNLVFTIFILTLGSSSSQASILLSSGLFRKCLEKITDPM